MLRFLTAGESHGPAQSAILIGIPAGLVVIKKDIEKELKKRHSDAGRGGRAAIESDEVEILSGIRHGESLGSPIALMIKNKDFENWKEKMSVDPAINQNAENLTTPRPGHADFAGAIKYGCNDIRNVLERASARETVMRVAVGSICKTFLNEFEIQIASHTIQIGSVKIERKDYSFGEMRDIFETDPAIRCIDKKARESMKEEILAARKQKNTLGGIVEVIAHNVPVGLGSHVHWDQKLDGLISQALMSIPSVKAVEIGNGVKNAKEIGSSAHDEILNDNGKICRKTNRAGGIEGGISNGEDIVCRVYHKPLATLAKPLNTIDIKTGKSTKAFVERSDVCVVPRAGVVSESMLAFVLAKEILEKFGGDHIVETKRNFESYIKSGKMK